jgi:hypothetical protein
MAIMMDLQVNGAERRNSCPGHFEHCAEKYEPSSPTSTMDRDISTTNPTAVKRVSFGTVEVREHEYRQECNEYYEIVVTLSWEAASSATIALDEYEEIKLSRLPKVEAWNVLEQIDFASDEVVPEAKAYCESIQRHEWSLKRETQDDSKAQCVLPSQQHDMGMEAAIPKARTRRGFLHRLLRPMVVAPAFARKRGPSFNDS